MLDIYQNELSALASSSINGLRVSGKKTVSIAGMIVSTRVIVTRSGKRMAVSVIEDRTGRIDVTLFSDLYQEVFQELDKDSIFVIKGTVSADDYTGGVKMVAETMMPLDQVRAQMAKRVLIHVESGDQVDHLLSQLPEVIKLHRGGRCRVTISYQSNQAGAELALGDAWRVKPNSELLVKLSTLCGQGKVVVEY